MREFNPIADRKLSEYYKLEADYFVYGIVNEDKLKKQKATDFIKYAVIDINELKYLMDEGFIFVDRQYSSYVCKEVNGKMCCPVNYNKDGSSSFIPIDIVLLKKLFGNRNIIVASKGFIWNNYFRNFSCWNWSTTLKKYNLSDEEIAFIESMIKPMKWY